MTEIRSHSQREVCLGTIPDRELLRALAELVGRGCRVEADLLAHLAEVETRQLHLDQGCSSMFAYCTEVLHFSEASAYNRIQVARAARRFPVLLDRIRRGEIHLSGARLLAPELTAESCVELLDLARHRSKRAIEELLADRAPKPDAAPAVRRLPPRPAIPARIETAPVHRASTPPLRQQQGSPAPLGQDRFRIQFTASRAVCEKLREAQALLRHQIPDGDLAAVFDRALTLLVVETRRKKFAQTRRPASAAQSGQSPGDRETGSRHIPAAIKREVAARDNGRCAFVASNGRRCASRDFLEFHHKQPWARSRRHSIDGIELRCRAHNHHAASQDYGKAHMERCRSGPRTQARP